MPAVSRLSGTPTKPEGFAVETSAGGSDYRYVLRVVDHADDEPGTVEVTERYEDGDAVDPKATDTVREVMNDYGYEVGE